MKLLIFSCSPGYKCVDDDCTRCQDIDECEAADNGGCSQLCVNTDGGRQVRMVEVIVTMITDAA